MVRDTRGAVLAEFVIAVVPLLMMTFGWLQLAWLYTANLLVKHAAGACVRAAVVIDDKPFNPGKNNGPLEDIQKATRMAANVEKDRQTFTSITCEYKNDASEEDVFGTVTATVTAEYACGVPLGRLIVCGADSKKTLVHTAAMPMQGAHYKVD